jgi:hypothetical protein
MGGSDNKTDRSVDMIKKRYGNLGICWLRRFGGFKNQLE